METGSGAAIGTEVRCPRHKHGEVIDGVWTVKCHQCSKAEGRPVYHRIGADGEIDDPEEVPPTREPTGIQFV